MAYTTIDDPSAYFHTQLYTGNNSTTQTITNDANSGDFQADWLWIKNRDNIEKHHLMDSNRGANKFLHSNETAAERTGSHASGHNDINSFSSNGFTITSNGSNDELNFGTRTYVAWQWKANGGTTSSNTDGNITSTVQANTTAGFSIVTYTGNGNDGDTVGHGLSGNWDLCILKNRGQTDYWTFSTTGTNQVLLLHDNVAQANHSTAYMTKASGVIGLVNAGDLGMVNNSSENYVAYVFKEVQGYSKFGSYTGNGNADGTFIYTGFKPAWVLVKNSSGSGFNWTLHDNKRNEFNLTNRKLEPNTNNAEDTVYDVMDFYSNGFKCRTGDAGINASGTTYIYMAFAEHPFVSSEGVPTTAR